MAAEVIKKNIMTWLFVMFVLVLAVFVLALVRILFIQSDDSWKENMTALRTDDVEPFRGDICAYDGRIMATSMPTYSVHWDLTVKDLSDSVFYKNVDTLAACMSNLFRDTTKAAYSAKFRTAYANRARYFLVKDKITLSQLTAMRKFPIFKAGRYRSGFISEHSYVRYLPHYSLAARTIGKLQDGKGLVGLEAAFNDKLAGTKGKKLFKKLPSGEWYPVEAYFNDDFMDVDPVDGMDIITTIDVNLQDIVEKSLRQQLVTSKAQQGIAVVMEVSTGKIRAISNLYRLENGDYRESDNYAVRYAFEPGSTFKIPAMMAYLEKTGANVLDSIDVGTGAFDVLGHEIKDDHAFRGKVSLQDVIAKSSNVGTAMLIWNTFKDSQEEFVSRLYKMGLNKKSGIDLIGEGEPLVRYPKESGTWRGSIAKMAYGYEVRITPLQVLTFYNAIANGGKMVRPHLLEEVRSHGEVVEKVKTEVINSAICSKETLGKIQTMMKAVVDYGTASAIKSDLYGIAGKTGTAQIAFGSEGYQGADGGIEHMASFVGYFPTEKPKYSCIVVVFNPKQGSYYASAIACPVFGKIADKLYSQDREMHLGTNFNLMQRNDIRNNVPRIKTGDREVIDRLCSTFNIRLTNVENAQSPYVAASATKEGDAVMLESVSSQKMVVPNVVGMGLRDAMFLLRNREIDVIVVGRGTVKKQSIPASTTITKGMKIKLELS